MGVRLSTNLQGSRFAVDHVEVSEAGRERLKQAVGADCVEMDTALSQADVVVMAVPDRLIGKIAHDIIGKVRPGTALIVLDAAAPYAGEMPVRPDVTYFVTHPCHPPIFNDETDPVANPMKAKGVGELGICGVAAAVANAIYNATGVRVRDYPVTLDKLLAKMPI